MLSWFGCLLVAASVATRGMVVLRSKQVYRKIELVGFLCNVGVVAALVGYYLTTKDGMEMAGVESEGAVHRWQISITALWLILLLTSLVPLVMSEIALGARNRFGFLYPKTKEAQSSVDAFRVREMASSGLSMALAACFLLVTCHIAEERNIRKDVSYFKTSGPGTATQNIVKSLNEPLKVLLFFPENNEVKVEVEQYFKELNFVTSNLHYEVRDRLVDGALAKEHRVGKDGTIVLLRGDASEKFQIKTDINVARRKELRELDSTFQASLMAVIRDTKTAYFMVGHGELNDPKSGGVINGPPSLLKSTLIKSALKQLNYKTKDYDGFGQAVPDDCSLLFVLAPRVALMESELQAIDDYLAKGGAAIIAMDPDSEMRLGVLQSRLGVSFNSTPLADDKEFKVETRTPWDHSVILTNQFMSHAAISTLSRESARSAILFVKAGSFDEVPFAKGEGEQTKKVEIIRSMQTSFRDIPDEQGQQNFVFDEATEKRSRFPVAIAVEKGGGEPEGEGSTEKQGMRVVLLADREVLSDGILARVGVVQNMLIDFIKWTGGEESFAGEIISEKDNRIEHTKSQDTVWFYGTVVGAPVLVLSFGLLFVTWRRRRRRIRK
jgi:hypothetical protein